MNVAALNREAGTKPRVALDAQVVKDYALAMRLGEVFPPVMAITDGETYWLIDGYHRVAALALNGTTSVVVAYTRGTFEDALWESCAVNKTHGLHRSNEDKRQSVERALSTERGARLSDRQVARFCGVHHDTVGRIRRSLETAGVIEQVAEREVLRHGCQYRQDVNGVALSNKRRGEAGPADCEKAAPCAEATTAPAHVNNTPEKPRPAASLAKISDCRDHLAVTSPLEVLEDFALDLVERTSRLIGGAVQHCNLEHTAMGGLLQELRELSERLVREVRDARNRPYRYEEPSRPIHMGGTV
jgi:hypothetical protein